MADKSKKYPENIPGQYYVDRECIACDACIMAAPDFFAMDPDDGHAYVIKQPVAEGDHAQCKEAMEGCPVEAIGSDGDDDQTTATTA